MTIKEAILKSLEEIVNPATSLEVFNYIINSNMAKIQGERYTVAATLGNFIRDDDTRVKRIKYSNSYLYYLSKNEDKFDINEYITSDDITSDDVKKKQNVNIKTFSERDLHILLSTFLNNSNIYVKTIFHEQSNNRDNNQIWVHPDMVGVEFMNLKTKTSQNLLKIVNRIETFKISSYELKKEIKSDAELKKAFFQTFSNSGWANYGYLVAFEIGDNLMEELKRLNQSFGIGIIKLNANPYKSKILFQARFKELDFKTLDKLCDINKEFEKFIELIEKLMTAEERYYDATEKELLGFCDSYLKTDSEIEKYCKEKNIPLEDTDKG